MPLLPGDIMNLLSADCHGVVFNRAGIMANGQMTPRIFIQTAPIAGSSVAPVHLSSVIIRIWSLIWRFGP